jgi:type II secretory ATPase GspE/PulE/Tfp pilus assembly ATPase PilB-like protein
MDEIQTDPLIKTIEEHSLLPKEKINEIFSGKSRNLRNTNLVLSTLAQAIPSQLWLEGICEKLLNLHFIIQNELGGGNTLPDFHYIPCPGKKNGERISHAEEKPKHRLILGRTPSAQDIANSPLALCPDGRSRETCWVIPYHNSKGHRKLVFLLTFDPHHLVKLRTNTEETQQAKEYWENLARLQGKISPKESPAPLFLYGLTGLHEWLQDIFPPEGQEKEEWERQLVPEHEREKASTMGLDLYFSSPVAAYGWSTLEKPKGRERARTNLQQLLSKKVVLFDPIYGRSTGTRVTKPEGVKNLVRLPETERELTARAMWQNALTQAYSTGASDIHLEPQKDTGQGESNLVISLRKDNEMTFFAKCPKGVGENVIRFALEGSGVIRSDTEHGQDGRKTWIHPKKKAAVDLRISVTPMASGTMQEVVIRLLDNSRLKGGLGELGLEPEELDIWRRALAIEESLILVSGPTGSGKSSTLFSAICDIHLRDPNRKITSIEDPIEYSFPFRATQHEVKESSRMNFPAYIRRMMRNDVDTVLVGEIRDAETLMATLNLGLTGHQVLSTIHAKSAADTVLRMLEFKPEPYMVSEVPKLVVAQRLAATPCPVCTRTLPLNEAEEQIQAHGGLQRVLAFSDQWKSRHPHTGEKGQGIWKTSDGCPACRFTGVQGKTAIQEFLIIHQHNKKYLKEGNIGSLQDSMKELGLYNLETTAWKMAWKGKISIKEAGRFTNTLEEDLK